MKKTSDKIDRKEQAERVSMKAGFLARSLREHKIVFIRGDLSETQSIFQQFKPLKRFLGNAAFVINN